MKKIFLYLLAACTLPTAVIAQDPHWSMIQWNPVYLNPAFSGFAQKANRITGIYRDQWRAVAVPYSTTHFAYDRRVIHQNNNRFGVGVQMMYDRAGDGALSIIRPGISAAYGRYFNSEKQLVHIGVNAAYSIRQLDFNKFTFDNQYNGFQFDPGIPPAEQLESNNAGYFDLGAGLNFNSKLKEAGDIDFGVSAFNLTQPSYSFLNTSETEPGTRIMAYTKANINLGKSAWQLHPAFFYQNQQKAQEYLFQSLLSVRVSDPAEEDKQVRLIFGPGYRLDDAVIGYIGVNWNDLRVAFAFDGNVSDFRTATNGRGAYELMVNYEFEKTKEKPTSISLSKEGIETNDPDEVGNFIAKYEINVHNSGKSKAVYSLTDIPYFDKEVTINSAALSGHLSNVFHGGGPYKFGEDILIEGDKTHTYILTISARYSHGIMHCTSQASKCETDDSGNFIQGRGLYNEATLRTSNYEITKSACLNPHIITCPEPLLSLNKKAIGTDTGNNPSEFIASYRVTVSNIGEVETTYSLSDLPEFDSQINIINARVSDRTLPFEGPGPYTLATDRNIAAGEVHEYLLDISARFDNTIQGLLSRSLSSCITDSENNFVAGGGLCNKAELIFGNNLLIAADCINPPSVDVVDTIVPLQLFFDNDQPNPRSRATTTDIDYGQTITAYLERQAEFVQRSGDEAGLFFADNVTKGYNNLNAAFGSMKTLLDNGKKITIRMKGFASPLAPADYNEALSSRRIHSVYNYMMMWSDGILAGYINDGQLSIEKVPLGESAAPEGISDSRKDLLRSVYSRDASYERRVEIIGVTVE